MTKQEKVKELNRFLKKYENTVLVKLLNRDKWVRVKIKQSKPLGGDNL